MKETCKCGGTISLYPLRESNLEGKVTDVVRGNCDNCGQPYFKILPKEIELK